MLQITVIISDKEDELDGEEVMKYENAVLPQLNTGIFINSEKLEVEDLFTVKEVLFNPEDSTGTVYIKEYIPL